MKSNIVRLFVVTLALAGFGATAVSAHTSSNAHKISATNNDLPMPLCMPNDPSACGLH